MKGTVMGLKAIVLAAGKGTRMRSEILKVAHHVAGKPIVSYVIEAVLKLNVDDIMLVVGHQAELIKETVKHEKLRYVLQEQQLGTGHAVLQTVPFFDSKKENTVIILAGDCPLIEESTLKSLLAIHSESNAVGTILTAKMKDPGNYGRILRGKMGTVIGIKEAKDCNQKEANIKEINTGVYVFEASYLMDAISKIKTDNAQQEYYLTDVIHILKDFGEVIAAYCIEDEDQIIGINTRMDQARINKIIYQRNNKYFMENGVTIVDPDTTYIDSTVKIGVDTIVSPFAIIQGDTVIGKHCKIGPYAYVNNGNLSDNQIVSPFEQIES
jgi:bifunctional UDP-N-acetylglucosamine pyrophosphorylase / glucosamine-1-phosphate N-acetyltransferase